MIRAVPLLGTLARKNQPSDVDQPLPNADQDYDTEERGFNVERLPFHSKLVTFSE